MKNWNSARYDPERISETLATLEKARQRSASCLVSFSGGKDSLATLDMAVRTFDHVEAFFMCFVPGIRSTEDVLEETCQRYGIKLHVVPHWFAYSALRAGEFCDPAEGLPEMELRDIYQRITAKAGIPIVLMGARRTEGVWRRKDMAKMDGWAEVFMPLAGWSKMDVLSYLSSRGITLPPAARGEGNGVSLLPSNVLWLYDNHRDDYERLRRFFPYVEAIIRRRDFFGIGAEATTH